MVHNIVTTKTLLYSYELNPFMYFYYSCYKHKCLTITKLLHHATCALKALPHGKSDVFVSSKSVITPLPPVVTVVDPDHHTVCSDIGVCLWNREPGNNLAPNYISYCLKWATVTSHILEALHSLLLHFLSQNVLYRWVGGTLCSSTICLTF